MSGPSGRRPHLTDRDAWAVPLPSEGSIEVPVGGVPGLRFRMSATGRRVFRLITRRPGQRSVSHFPVGAVPLVSVERARELAAEFIERIPMLTDRADAEGVDLEALVSREIEAQLPKIVSTVLTEVATRLLSKPEVVA